MVVVLVVVVVVVVVVTMTMPFRSADGSNISTPYIEHLQTASVACPDNLAGTLALRCQDNWCQSGRGGWIGLAPLLT